MVKPPGPHVCLAFKAFPLPREWEWEGKALIETSESNAGETVVQKVINIVGVSNESFAKAADNAVEAAAKSVRNMKWARVHDLEMGLEGDKVIDYRATVRIYFDVD